MSAVAVAVSATPALIWLVELIHPHTLVLLMSHFVLSVHPIPFVASYSAFSAT